MRTHAHRMLVTMIVLGITGALAGAGTYSAFWSTTKSPGNTFDAGTVYVNTNASGVLLTLSSARPSDPAISGCIVATYGGTLNAGAKLYGSTTGTIAPYLNLVVETGTTSSPFNSCATFSATGTIYSGLLSSFPASYLTGIADPDTTWSPGETHAYRFTVSVANNPAGQGLSGQATFTWETRSL